MNQIAHANLPVLQAGNCVLVPMTLDLVSPDYVDWLNDPRINSFLETRFNENTLGSVKSFVIHQLSSGSVLFYAIFSNTLRHIGNIKLGPINFSHLHADIGFLIGDEEFWGQGIATSAISALVNYGFSLGLEKITAGAYENNIGSIKALEKSGFRKEGLMDKQVLHDDVRVGAYIFGLTN